MKSMLIQHPHGTEISGVITYVQNTRSALESTGNFTVQVVSSKTQSAIERLRALRGVEYVHLNSNDLILAAAARLSGKKVFIKYHWPFWLSTRYGFESLGWRARFRHELLYIWSEYVRRRGLYAGLRAYARLAMRLVTFATIPTRLAVSDFTAGAVEAGARVKSVPNPYDFGPLLERRLPESVAPRFVFLGRIVEDKGLDLVIEAAALVAAEGFNFEVVVLGDGPEVENLRGRAVALGLEGVVHFAGRKSRDELLAILRSSLAVVCPSRIEEPAGYAPIEAASQGVTSIVARAGGLPETAGPSGYFFDREDHIGLARAMTECLLDPSDALERGYQWSREARGIYGADAAAQTLTNAIGEPSLGSCRAE